MPERYFLDANVLFTAAISPHGVSSTLLDLARVGACRAVTSDFALDEALRNVLAKYPSHLDALEAIALHLELGPAAPLQLVTWAEAKVVQKDAPILASAVGAKSNVLVTGDRRHFGALYGTTLRGVTVLPPRDALERLLDR